MERPPRLVALYAGARAFSPLALTILPKIGYQLIPVERYAELAARPPDVQIVEEQRLSEIYETTAASSIPTIVLVGWRGAPEVDGKIVVAAVRSPAGLHELYRVLQQALEETPRAVPRVETRLRARCRRDTMEWDARVISLSENGCLLKTSVVPPLGAMVDVSFELPDGGKIETQASASYQVMPQLGLVFHATRPEYRRAIASYVTHELAR
ncbi:MAG: PilZ domain-containing protein [Deltaproteobacteria bacterium]|nr:PilZ domain-containing protein [Deltaproteobacteria bacterium]MBW2446385.1 PilZ domain-containing protein [Deltaproteobacteria bacterium]